VFLGNRRHNFYYDFISVSRKQQRHLEGKGIYKGGNGVRDVWCKMPRPVEAITKRPNIK